MDKIKNIKIKSIRKILIFVALLTAVSVVGILVFFPDDTLPSYLCLFIKDMTGCAVLSFVLSLGTYFFEKKKKDI